MNLESNGVDTLPSRVDSFAAGLSRHWPRAKQWSLRLAEFGLVQGLVQLLTAVAGLLIVRTLAKQDYALYAIANSMQTMVLACGRLVDACGAIRNGSGSC